MGDKRGRNLGGGQPGNRQDNRQRGNAAQLLEKYKSMARDSQLAGDRVQTEYYLQYRGPLFPRARRKPLALRGPASPPRRRRGCDETRARKKWPKRPTAKPPATTSGPSARSGSTARDRPPRRRTRRSRAEPQRQVRIRTGHERRRDDAVRRVSAGYRPRRGGVLPKPRKTEPKRPRRRARTPPARRRRGRGRAGGLSRDFPRIHWWFTAKSMFSGSMSGLTTMLHCNIVPAVSSGREFHA